MERGNYPADSKHSIYGEQEVCLIYYFYAAFLSRDTQSDFRISVSELKMTLAGHPFQSLLSAGITASLTDLCPAKERAVQTFPLICTQ